VLFPGAVIPIDVGRRSSLRLLEHAADRKLAVIGVVTQRDERIEHPGPADVYTVGSAARLISAVPDGGSFRVSVEGVARVRIASFEDGGRFLTARVTTFEDPTASDTELEELAARLRDAGRRLVKRMPDFPQDLGVRFERVRHAGYLADVVTSHMPFEPGDKQAILEEPDPKARVRKALRLVARALERLPERRSQPG
jgi:ATP-dependent Lon protease